MLSELVSRIASATNLTDQEVKDRVSAKQAELLGLISPEGAAHLIANELGVSLKKQERLFIKNLIPGMQSVEVIGRVISVSEKDYKTEKSSGKLASLLIGDETATIRLVLWNDDIKKIEAIKKNDVVKLRATVNDGIYGAELRLQGGIVKTDDKIELPVRQSSRTSIVELNQGDFKELRACVVQIFESISFYDVCSQCGVRMKETGCEEHGNIEPKHGVVISGIIDDGTENMRAVFFGENAERIIRMKTEEARSVLMRKFDKAAVLQKVLLGEELIIEGTVKRNKMFDRLEFVVSNIKDVDIKTEIESIMDRMNNDLE